LSKIQVDTIDTRSGTSTMQIGSTNTTTITLGVSGDTINVPSGVTIANAGTATGFGEDNSPYFRAVGSGSQSVATATMTTIVFNSEQLDSDNGYDTSTYKYTIPSGKGGLWFFQAAIYSAAVSDGVQTDLMIYKNSSTEVGFNRVKAGGSIAPAMITGLIANVAAGDALYARFQQYNGSNVTIYPNNDAAYFAGFRIKSI
jgi:hypothetical protein